MELVIEYPGLDAAPSSIVQQVLVREVTLDSMDLDCFEVRCQSVTPSRRSREKMKHVEPARVRSACIIGRAGGLGALSRYILCVKSSTKAGGSLSLSTASSVSEMRIPMESQY